MNDARSPEVDPEREVLEVLVNRNRDALVAAVSPLTDEESRQRLVPSLTSPITLVKHCAAVERFWFQRTLAGLPAAQCDGYAGGGDAGWRLAKSDTLAGVISEYRRATELSIEIASRYPLDHAATHPRRHSEIPLRWILAHMIEELARHAGHADILVEQIVAAR